MPERKISTFRLDPDLIDGLQAVYERDGVLPSEQVRRAIRAWLDRKGVQVRPPRKFSAGVIKTRGSNR